MGRATASRSTSLGSTTRSACCEPVYIILDSHHMFVHPPSIDTGSPTTTKDAAQNIYTYTSKKIRACLDGGDVDVDDLRGVGPVVQQPAAHAVSLDVYIYVS